MNESKATERKNPTKDISKTQAQTADQQHQGQGFDSDVLKCSESRSGL